ncbi:MAG: inositol monophosphatase family protein [Eubacteriales bacterium]|nr:inositol monophosphatase family protein [Eubacteriales bacterium]
MQPEALIAIAKEAGAMMRRSHDAAIHEKEGHYNFVTDTDVAVQAYLKSALLTLCPGARFYAEEQENEPLTDAPTFVVDPIDGTINYMRLRHMSAVSIGYLEGRQPVMAVVYNPYANELFYARKGRGAFLNGQPIRVSDLPYNMALVELGTSPYDAELAKQTMAAAGRFLSECGDLRRSGSAAIDLCGVACGRADIFFELRLRPWDVAAGALIVEEAGGRFISLGHDAPFFEAACGMLACNAACAADALRVLQEVTAK